MKVPSADSETRGWEHHPRSVKSHHPALIHFIPTGIALPDQSVRVIGSIQWYARTLLLAPTIEALTIFR